MGEGHSKLAPSAAKRWIACPGSIALGQGSGVEETSSRAADEGTFAHDIAARCLEEGKDALAMIGETDGVFEVDFDMADYLQVYLDVVDRIESIQSHDGAELYIEEKVRTKHKDVSGTADALIYDCEWRTLHVVDLKYGAGIYVEVEDNPQLMVYALGALEIHKHTERVIVHIVQPRCSTPAHRWVELSSEFLRKWDKEVLTPAVKATYRKNAKLDPGDHCLFCPAKPQCPALRSLANSKAKAVFAKKSPPDPTELSAEKIAEILVAAPLIEMWLKSIREHAHTQLKGGTQIPGYKLVKRLSNRSWDDEQLAKCFGIPMATPKILSPAQAEKKVDKSLVESLLALQTESIIMVQESDGRPGLSCESPFSVIPQKGKSKKKSKGKKK